MASPHGGPMQTWWEGIAKARDQIQALSRILGPLGSLDSLQESERPAKGLLEDEMVADRLCLRLSQPNSGRGDDELCQWLYETYQTGDADLQNVVLRYVPILCGVYLPRVTRNANESLAGFEAVLLALYTAETKARGGRPLVVNIPDLSQPSLYHAPRIASNAASAQPRVGQFSAPLEPQVAVKATKRACIVGVALELFCRRIALMPTKAKIEACHYTESWAGPFCLWAAHSQQHAESNFQSVDALALSVKRENEVLPNGSRIAGSPVREIEVVEAANELQSRQAWSSEVCASPSRGPSSTPSPSPSRKDHQLGSQSGKYGHVSPSFSATEIRKVDIPGETELKTGLEVRIPLPWELLRPIVKLLGHCLMAPLNPRELRDAASAASRALYFRASHDLVPEAILATRSLIQLDSASRVTAKAASTALNATASKPRKPEILLVSK